MTFSIFSCFCISNQLYFKPPDKAVILSEALRRPVANRGLYSAESKDPGAAYPTHAVRAFSTTETGRFVVRDLWSDRDWNFAGSGRTRRKATTDYHAVPENLRALRRFRERLRHLWRSMLGRRSQRSRPSWKRIHPTFERWLPRARVLHPYPDVRFDAIHPRQEPCAVVPLARICTGGGQR